MHHKRQHAQHKLEKQTGRKKTCPFMMGLHAVEENIIDTFEALTPSLPEKLPELPSFGQMPSFGQLPDWSSFYAPQPKTMAWPEFNPQMMMTPWGMPPKQNFGVPKMPFWF
jgi:hypothetical protein